MIFRTHLAFAFFIGLFFDFKSLIVILIGSLIPDLDTSNSKIGRKFIFSRLLNFLFGHRRFFHSLFFGAILSFFVFLVFGKYYFMIFIGFFSHLFLDCLTKDGVMLFYPFEFKVKGFIKTNGIIENSIFLILIFLIIIKLINLG